MLDLSAGQGRAPETNRFATAIANFRVEVGACHDGLCCGAANDSEGVYGVWVIVDRLTKTVHFLPFSTRWSVEKLAWYYIREVVRMHGVPASIVSDRDSRFTFRFWQSFQEAMGTETLMSSAYHPQTDGQTERMIQILEDLLRACCLDWGGSWDQYLALAEFTYNNSY